MQQDYLYKAIFENMNEGVYSVDKDKRIKLWNKAAEKITGYKKEEMLGLQCQNSGLKHIDSCGTPLCILDCPLSKSMLDGKIKEAVVIVRHKDGRRIPINIKAIPIYNDNNEISGALEIFSLISNKMYDDSLIDSLSRIAMTDELTGLPNRRMAESFLAHRISEYKRIKKSFGIIYVDIDNFSNINNVYGHDMGDEVLKNVSNAMVMITGIDDMIARWGGEEFIGIFTADGIESLGIIAEEAREKVLSTITRSNGIEVKVTISLGAAIYKPNDTPDSLIKRADSLLYKSKRNGKNQASIEA